MADCSMQGSSCLQADDNFVLPELWDTKSKDYKQFKSGLIPVKESELPGSVQDVVHEFWQEEYDTERGSEEQPTGS